MSWTEIKHAINSTLGTNKFVSLDKQIEALNLQVNTQLTDIKNQLNYLENQRVASLTGEGTVVYENATGITARLSGNDCIPCAKFIAPICGIYKVSGSISDSTNIALIKIGKTKNNNFQYNASKSAARSDGNSYYYYQELSLSRTYSLDWNREIGDNIYNTIKSFSKIDSYELVSFNFPNSGVNFYCEAGEPVVLALSVRSTSTVDAKLANIKVTYQDKGR